MGSSAAPIPVGFTGMGTPSADTAPAGALRGTMRRNRMNTYGTLRSSAVQILNWALLLWRSLRHALVAASKAARALMTCREAVKAPRLPCVALTVLSLALAKTFATHAAETSNVTTPIPPTTEDFRRLAQRVEQLEAREKERGPRSPANTDQAVEALLGRIGQLEAKIAALEAGKVPPESGVTAETGPTVQEPDLKVRVIEQKNEASPPEAAATAQPASRVSVGKNGVSFSSADTNFVVKLRGVLQVDSRTFFEDNPLSRGNDGFILRRARPILEGTLWRDLDFSFVPDFGGSSTAIFDAYLQYRLKPEFQVRAGKFKGPVGLEQLFSDASLPFNERSLVTGLVPNRSLGVQLGGEFAEGVFGYAAGIFNASGDARNTPSSDFSDDKEFAGRVFFQPFKPSDLVGLRGLGFGLGGSYGQVSSNAAGLPATTGGTLPGYATEAQQQFFAYNPTVGTVVADGVHWRLSPQAYYLAGPFGIVGEYAISHQRVLNNATLQAAELEHTAWNLTAQWVLTGEKASLTGIDPARPFRVQGGGWGAWQLVARYGQTDLDQNSFLGFSNPKTSASGASAWSVGVNWWLNRNLRVLTSFSHTTFDGGGAPINPSDSATLVPPGLVTQQSENALLTRLQLSF